MLALPNSNGAAFPPRVNMPEKLDQLEEERNYLLRMCLKEMHKDYDERKESTLALPYQRSMIKSGNIDMVTNVDDAIKINYDTSWLPPYSELRVVGQRLFENKEKMGRRFKWQEQSRSSSYDGRRRRNSREKVLWLWAIWTYAWG